MFANKKIIVSLKENFVEIAVVSGKGKRVKIHEVKRLTPSSDMTVVSDYKTEENRLIVSQLLKSHGIRNPKTKVILSSGGGMVSRVIETPILKINELKKYIENNLKDLFAVNINEYYFDFKIVDTLPEEETKGKRYAVLVAIILKSKIHEEADNLMYFGLNIDEILIYPDVIQRLFLSFHNRYFAVLDSNNGNGCITIFEGNRMFLTSSLENEYDEKDPHAYVEEIGYFLNFFATRHAGNRVDAFFITGRFDSRVKLIEYIREHYDVEVKGSIDVMPYKIVRPKGLDTYSYLEVIGSMINVKEVYNKGIDFGKNCYFRDIKVSTVQGPVRKYASALVLATLIFLLSFEGYKLYVNLRYNLKDINKKIAALSEIESKKKEYEKLKFENEKEKIFTKKIEDEKFDYKTIMDKLQKGIPNFVAIDSFNLTREGAAVTFKINNNTVDAAKLAIAINDIGIFEPVEIGNIKLDNTVNKISFNLKFKKVGEVKK